jgi:hypothetical protein
VDDPETFVVGARAAGPAQVSFQLSIHCVRTVSALLFLRGPGAGSCRAWQVARAILGNSLTQTGSAVDCGFPVLCACDLAGTGLCPEALSLPILGSSLASISFAKIQKRRASQQGHRETKSFDVRALSPPSVSRERANRPHDSSTRLATFVLHPWLRENTFCLPIRRG